MNKLDSSDRLFAGVILTIVGLVGLAYRSMDYSIVIGDLKGVHSFYGTYNLLSLVITGIFIAVTLLGIYIVYDTIRKDSRT